MELIDKWFGNFSSRDVVAVLLGANATCVCLNLFSGEFLLAGFNSISVGLCLQYLLTHSK